MKKFLSPVVSLALAAMQLSAEEISLVKISEGFSKPLWVGSAPGAPGHLWVAEQTGRVWIVDRTTGKRREAPFLDLSGAASAKNNEQGFLGLAFAPDFLESGRFYVNYTDAKGDTWISRFTVDKDKRSEARADTEEKLLKIEQPYANHNGGWIGFGPDGMLYVATGDGGAANDPGDYGQKLSSHLGKILRMDVSPATGYKVPQDNPFVAEAEAKPEIWMWGLRNPWRCSFDRKTGDFWIGDVGQNKMEEVNFVPAGKGSGWNFGWRPREGSIATPTGGVGGEKAPGFVDPIFEYPHQNGDVAGFSVTGGHVYRGPSPSLQGRYFVADYQLPRLWSFVEKNGKQTDLENYNKQLSDEEIRMISSFGEDLQGNLYFTDHAVGTVWMIR